MVSINNAVDQYLEEGESFLDQFIDSGSDQELFIASYIHGHYSVVAANLLSNLAHFQDIGSVKLSFRDAMFRSIENAIREKELSEQDALQVRLMLNDLFTKLDI